jgi:hypothetical protein
VVTPNEIQQIWHLSLGTTIRENVTYGLPDASDDAVRERGVRPSGGQRQRAQPAAVTSAPGPLTTSTSSGASSRPSSATKARRTGASVSRST